VDFRKWWSVGSIEFKPTYIQKIKAKLFEDENLNKPKEKVVNGETPDATLDVSGVLGFKERICAPRIEDLVQKGIRFIQV